MVERPKSRKLYLTLLNGTGYIFNLDDYMRVRIEHRLIGIQVGTTCTKGWSANEYTLPVELSPCETRLLIEQGIGELVSKRLTLLQMPTAVELEINKSQLEFRLADQLETLKIEKLKETKRNLEKIINGKRIKLRHGTQSVKTIQNPQTIMQDVTDSIIFNRKTALLDIISQHAEAQTVQVVKLMSENSFNYRIFCDFWHRGKFITKGAAFGADFLIYPGDPLLYHASHIALVHQKPTLNPTDLIAKVRLSVIVNKHCVIAYCICVSLENDCDQPDIHYQTIAWDGNRDKKE